MRVISQLTITKPQCNYRLLLSMLALGMNYLPLGMLHFIPKDGYPRVQFFIFSKYPSTTNKNEANKKK